MKKLTVTIDDDVYAGLHARVGAGRISRFVNDLVRPLVSDAALEDGYAAMAADDDREREADEWCEALIGDVAADA
jgi:Arc/MetJ family transcription regulator